MHGVMVMDLSKLCKYCNCVLDELNAVKKNRTTQEFSDKCKKCFRKIFEQARINKFKREQAQAIQPSSNKFTWIMRGIKGVFYRLDKTLEKMEK
jgi:ABC-type polysaccharide/polyol phosphate transport system ATPase subunit